jgi:hypothetical protein
MRRSSSRKSVTERLIAWLQTISEASGNIWRSLPRPLKFVGWTAAIAVGQRVLLSAGLAYSDLPAARLLWSLLGGD